MISPQPSPPEWLALVERLPIPAFYRECRVKTLAARLDGCRLVLTAPDKLAFEWITNRQSLGDISPIQHIDLLRPDWQVELCFNPGVCLIRSLSKQPGALRNASERSLFTR